MTPEHSADIDLIRQIKERDPDGLARAYDRYSAAAFGLFLRITRDRAVAEDLLQELFLRIWNRGREFDVSRGPLGVWIMAIARNMGIDYLRSADARFITKLRSIDYVDPTVFSHKAVEPDVDSKRAVSTALAGLNANEKRVLEMAYFEGCSQTEIAAKLHEPLGTVKTWMRTGLGRLRSAMKSGAAR